MQEGSRDVQEPLADLKRRARKALVIASDESLPAWRRTVETLKTFSGTYLTGLPPKVKRAIEKHFVAVNQVLGEYELNTMEDYQHIEQGDLERILDIITSLVSKIMLTK
jgi:hypothetical protein